ncbi:hypothetical protein SNEBB_007328 [Seison nebaliae]|nr:hypothetical protein SNEBB_007328 [Seison nebaliae]
MILPTLILLSIIQVDGVTDKEVQQQQLDEIQRISNKAYSTTFQRMAEMHQSRTDITYSDLKYLKNLVKMKLAANTEEIKIRINTIVELTKSTLDTVDIDEAQDYLALVTEVHDELDNLQELFAKATGTTFDFLTNYLGDLKISEFRLQRRVNQLSEIFVKNLYSVQKEKMANGKSINEKQFANSPDDNEIVNEPTKSKSDQQLLAEEEIEQQPENESPTTIDDKLTSNEENEPKTKRE